MAKYYGDACISDGEYEKDGEKKKSWMKVGTVVQQDSGSLSVHLPLFGKWINIFPKQQGQQQGQSQGNKNQESTYTQPGSSGDFQGNAQMGQQEPPPHSDNELPFP